MRACRGARKAGEDGEQREGGHRGAERGTALRHQPRQRVTGRPRHCQRGRIERQEHCQRHHRACMSQAVSRNLTASKAKDDARSSKWLRATAR